MILTCFLETSVNIDVSGYIEPARYVIEHPTPLESQARNLGNGRIGE